MISLFFKAHNDDDVQKEFSLEQRRLGWGLKGQQAE